MSDDRRPRPAHLELLAIAWNFGWPIATGVFLGYWLDERLGTSPGLTLGFGIGAMAAAVQRLIGLTKRETVERHEAEESDRASAASAQPGPEAPAPEEDGKPK